MEPQVGVEKPGATGAATYFERDLPGAFKRNLAELEEKVKKLTRTLEDVRAADARVQVKVTGEGGGSWILNVRGGEIAAESGETADAVLTIAQDVEGFRASASGAVGGNLSLFGSGGGTGTGEQQIVLRLLTKSKLDRLASVKGTIHFKILEVLNGRDLAVTVKSGKGPLPEKPDCTVLMKAADYREFAAGKLTPQVAFMAGKVKIEGNMNVALQLGSVMFLT